VHGSAARPLSHEPRFPRYKRHQRRQDRQLADEISTAAQHAQLSDGPCSKDPLTKPCFPRPDEVGAPAWIGSINGSRSMGGPKRWSPTNNPNYLHSNNDLGGQSKVLGWLIWQGHADARNTPQVRGQTMAIRTRRWTRLGNTLQEKCVGGERESRGARRMLASSRYAIAMTGRLCHYAGSAVGIALIAAVGIVRAEPLHARMLC